MSSPFVGYFSVSSLKMLQCFFLGCLPANVLLSCSRTQNLLTPPRTMEASILLFLTTDERPHCPSDPFCKILTSKVNGVRRNCCFFLLSFPTGARPRQPVYPAAGSSIKVLLPCVGASAHMSPCAARRRTHCFVFASLRAPRFPRDTRRRRKCDAPLCCSCAVN